MPKRPKFSKSDDRCKDLDLIIPGLDLPDSQRRGRNKDRFRVSSETRVPEVYAARQVMVRDLASRLLFPILRARLEGRFTTSELHDAYRQGDPALAKLSQSVAGHRLAPLLRQYAVAKETRDVVKTHKRIQRFIDYCGGDSEATTADMTTDRLGAFRNSLVCARPGSARAASNATKNRYQAAVAGFASYLIRTGKLKTHPTAFQALVKLDEGDHRMPELRSDEYGTYFARATAKHPQKTLVLRLAVHTGADMGELMALRVRSCDLDRPQPRIRFRRTKTRTPERMTPLPKPFADELRKHIADYALSRDDLVFGMWKRSSIEWIHKTVRRGMGRPELRIKDLRHIAAIYWRRAGADLETVREWMGHSTIAQTVAYASFAPDDEHDAPAVNRALALLQGEEPSQLTS